MEYLAMCNLSHVLIDEFLNMVYCTKLGNISQCQQSTFELILLLTAELFLYLHLSSELENLAILKNFKIL